jgi:hypothetical protein
MSFLLDPLPEHVDIDGAEIPINWDFRISIRFAELVQSADKDSADVLYEGLELYYPTVKTQVFDLNKAVEQMEWFFMAGRTDPPKVPGMKDAGAILSYEYDGGYIYAAFLSQYGIDLADVGDLHWWKFKAMMDGLSEDQMLVKIMGYRGLDKNDFAGMTKESKAHYRKMQKIYALPSDIKPEDRARLDEINAALMSGGDLSKIMGR